MIKNKKINAIIIGTGKMASNHFRAIKTLGINLSGIYDKSNHQLNKFQKLNKLKNIYKIKDLEQFLSKNKIDLSIISTTADSHYKYVKRCAEKKIKFIFVEKPMANSINDCKKMIQLCKNKKSRLQVNHSKIFSEEYKRVYNFVKSNKLGKLVSINISAGNIGLAMNAIHYIYCFLQLTNSKIKDVNGCFEEKNLFNPRGKSFLDQSGQIQIRNKNNQYLFINALRKNSHGINSIYSFENGNIFFSEIDGFCYISKRKKSFHNFPSYRYGMPSKNLFFKYKKNTLEETTTKSLKFFLENKAIISSKRACETIEGLVAAYKSNKLNNLKCNLKNLNKKRKYPWA